MNWQEQAKQAYQQRIAEQEQAKQQAAEQQRRQLKAQFEEQQRRATEQATERARQATEHGLTEQQQQAEAIQRIADSLKRNDQERQVRLLEAQERLKHSQEPNVWISQDGRKFKSPRERDFWDAWIADSQRASEIPLIPQYPIGRYYADFAHIPSKTVIEIDSYRWHGKERRLFEKHYTRHQNIEDQGWHFIRLTGGQVFADPLACVLYVYNRITQIKS